MLPPGTLVNAIRSALAFVILPECFASFLSLATPDEMPKADKAKIKIFSVWLESGKEKWSCKRTL